MEGGDASYRMVSCKHSYLRARNFSYVIRDLCPIAWIHGLYRDRWRSNAFYYRFLRRTLLGHENQAYIIPGWSVC